MTGLPAWLDPLPDAERMRATDAWAIEERHVPGGALMERAGQGLAALVAETAPEGLVVILCGKGNNGGDGYVAARVLRERGREVRVVAVGAVEDLRGDAATAADAWLAVGGTTVPFAAGALDGAAVAVDCLLGTGFSGVPRGTIGEAIAALRAVPAPVVACDVPSGVDASTGGVAGEAVRAVATATFHAAKPGLYVHPGKAHSGEVRVVGIGIPDGAPVPAADVGLIGDGVVASRPRRDADSTKFASGHVLVAGGSRGLTGAACLSATGAMRTGAGYVTVCVPWSLEPIFEVKLTEAMSAGLNDEDGAHTLAGAGDVLDRAKARGGALVLGPGLGRRESALAFAREVALHAPVALVLDADGLNAHAGSLEVRGERTAPTILTPHGGELARLLGVDSDAVRAARLQHVREAAARSGAIVVLKGDDTLVAEPGGTVAVNVTGTPALATAGTGDVLSGMTGALLARGMDPFAAACAAVRLHGLAGRAAAARRGVEGVLAGDVAEAVPEVLRGDR